MRILFVDDDAMNRRVVRDMLQVLGLAMEEAEDGSSAIAMVDARSYDLILMDIRMPGMDGLAATRSIRDGSSANAAIPIIVVTADVSHDVRDRALAAGANDVVLKPVSMNDLIAAIGKATQDQLGGAIMLD